MKNDDDKLIAAIITQTAYQTAMSLIGAQGIGNSTSFAMASLHKKAQQLLPDMKDTYNRAVQMFATGQTPHEQDPNRTQAMKIPAGSQQAISQKTTAPNQPSPPQAPPKKMKMLDMELVGLCNVCGKAQKIMFGQVMTGKPIACWCGKGYIVLNDESKTRAKKAVAKLEQSVKAANSA